MKISVILTTILVAQVSASFFDVFQGAVLTVQNSFGKLLSDVVTDVKETVDCTILAMEHALSLSHDATTRYYHKCGSETNKTDSVSDARQDVSLPKVEVTLNLPNNEEYLQKVIPAEIDARINETLSKVLGNVKPHDNVQSIENVLAKESQELADVSVFVKKEMEKLSNEVTMDLKNMEKQRDSEASVDTILQEIKVLEKREQISKNTTEANEIHQVIDQVLGKLHTIEATEATENFKLEEILKDLKSNSNNSLVGLMHQFEEWKEEEARHLNDIKSKIQEHEKLTDHPGSYNSHEPNHTQPVIYNTDKDINKDDVETNENSQNIFNFNNTHFKETVDHNTSTRTTGGGNDKSLLVTKSPSTSQNYTSNKLNNTVLTSTLYSSIESPLKGVKIHPFAYEFSELTTLSDIIQNNVTLSNTNRTVTNTTLQVINRVPVNEPYFIQINEDNSNDTVTISTVTDTSSGGSGKEKSANLAANNNAVIKSASQNTESILISTTLESFKNENSKDSTKIKTIASLMVKNASVNASNSKTESVTTLDYVESTETMTPTIQTSLKVSASVTKTILSTEYRTATVNEKKSSENSLILTTKIVDDNNLNATIANTSLVFERALFRKAIQPEETGITGNGKSTEAITESKYTSTTRNGDFTDTTLISTPIPTMSTSESKTIPSSLSTKSIFSSVNKESSTIKTKIIYDNYSNNPMITTGLLSILDTTPVFKTLEPKKPTTATDQVKSSIDSNVTLKTTTSSTMESKPITETIQFREISTSAGMDESTKAITESTTTSITENDTETTVISLPTIVNTSTPDSVLIQAVDTTTLSINAEEYLYSTTNRLTKNTNTADGDEENDNIDSSTTVGMSLPEEENILAPDHEESLPSTKSPLKTSPATLMNTDSNSDDIITSTPLPLSETTTAIEITDLVESTTFTEDKEPLLLSTLSAVRDEVAIKNNDSIITVTNTSEKTDRADVTAVNQTVETITAFEEQELSSTTTQSAINKMVTKTAFPPTERIPTSASIMASRNEEDLIKPPRLKANAPRAPEVLNSPNSKLIGSSPLTISPPVNREWLTPNKFNQQNYKTNEEQRNNYDEVNGPISLSDRLLQQSLNNPEVPIYGQAMPPIARGFFNDVQEWVPPTRLIPDIPSQPPKIDNNGLQKAAFDFVDSAHLDSSIGKEKDILRNIPLIPNTPREPIDPAQIYNKNPSYVPPSQHLIRSPLSFDSASENTYRHQLSLTTHRPARTAAHANKNKNPSFDYDSFFHLRDPEAHQRALKEARQLMANSKRSKRIINNIMKNKNKFNARSIFG